VPANPIQVRLFSHGVLPTDLFAFFHTLLHSQIIFARSAVVEIIAVFKIDYARLHP